MHAARTFVAALVAILASGALAGCSPAEEPLLAIGRSASGEPVVHLRLCDPGGARLSLSDVSLATDPSRAPVTAAPADAPGSPGTSGADSSTWAIENRSDTRTAWTFEVGTVPTGWRVSTFPMVVVGHVRMTPTGSYFASVTNGTSEPKVSPVSFTKADLDGLADGEVIGHDGRSPLTSTLTVERFRKQADDVC